jgi:nondiscriminating aspartyl-tRNA synthetase
MGEVNFLIVRDRTGMAQAVLSPDAIAPLAEVLPETVITLTGTVVEEAQAPGGVELHDVTVEVLSPVLDPTPFPLYKKSVKVALPTLLDHAVVAHRALDRRAILRIASGVMAGFRQTLRDQDFTEIQTPKLVSTATESGANVFPVEYFGRKAYLAQSPQLYKQIMVGVFERVFEVGPVFRAEPHATSRHITEYVSLDAEFGFIHDHHDVMFMLTSVLRGILAHLQAHHAADLQLLNVELPRFPERIPEIHFPAAQQLLHDRFGVQDAIGEPELSPEHERLLGEWARTQHGSDFLFVTGYPMVKRPFYTRPDPADPRWSNSFDLLFRGLEITTGGQRLHRYADYLDAIARAKIPPEAIEGYLEAFKFGMPPHGGFAIGLERLVMQLLCLDNVKLATLFPRDMGRLSP